jgi:predicted nucleotidyltransferase
MFGILPKSYQLLLKTLSEFIEIEKAAIYGSRAIGNFKKGSDIDLVVYGSKISQETIFKLKTKLEQELPIPYFFDLTHYEELSNPELKNHIDHFGKVFYTS